MQSLKIFDGITTPPKKSPPSSVEHAYTAVTEEDVFSPTSNLKLLASISYMTSKSDSIRFDFNPPTKRTCRDQNYFGVIIDDNSKESFEPSLKNVNDVPPNPERANNRKQKSLGVLCRRFLDSLPNEVGFEIDLETSARLLGSGKRRMYDIINVLESLFAVLKVNKNKYRWLGLEKLPELLYFLKTKGENDQWPKKIEAMEEVLKLSAEKSVMKAVKSVIDQSNNQLKDDDDFEMNFNADEDVVHQRTSLIHLSRRFLMLLLSTPCHKKQSPKCQSNIFEDIPRIVGATGGETPSWYPHQLSMDVASALLVDNSNSALEREHLDRTRCRRMYDIANVLVGLNLVKKEHKLEYCKKIPVLRFCGPLLQPQPGEPKVELESPVCATVEPTIEKSDENLGPRKSFEDILQAAELLSQNENQRESTDLKPILPASAKVLKTTKTSFKQLQFVTKSGTKFIVNIKSLNGVQSAALALKRKRGDSFEPACPVAII